MQTGYTTGIQFNPWNPILTSAMYLAQDTSLIPVQSGYTQTAAYKYVTRIAVDQYWSAWNTVGGTVASLAWCYYFDVANPTLASTAGCASQSSIMATYMANSTVPGGGINTRIASYQQWQAWAAVCGVYPAVRPSGCTINLNFPLIGYEGAYSPGPLNSDLTATVTAATNASNAVLSVAGNGCIVGMTVQLLSVVGGTYAASYNGLTVTAATTNTCTVNLNSTGLGTLSSATLVYTGSGIPATVVSSATNAASAVLTTTGGYQCSVSDGINLTGVTGGTWAASYSGLNITAAGTNTCTVNLNSTSLGTLTGATLSFQNNFPNDNFGGYINYLQVASYLSSQLYTLQGTMYSDFVANGGIYPSQLDLSNSGLTWNLFYFDIYGYFPEGKCIGCTISGTTLTLGGTVTGFFKVGDTLFGAGVTGIGTGAGSNTTITAIATGTGTQVGDTLTLSQASTVSSATTMTSNVTPPLDLKGNATNSPIQAWPAVRNWNGNLGGFLLNRDLDPASNDNSPMWLEKVA